MLRSLHNFLFVSFDPGGLVIGRQAAAGAVAAGASAKLFGFSPLSLLLPEAIAGVLRWRSSTMLARRLGDRRGFAGALALAVFPSFVAVSRDERRSTRMLILLMLLACGAGLRAAETGRWRTLLAAACS